MRPVDEIELKGSGLWTTPADSVRTLASARWRASFAGGDTSCIRTDATCRADETVDVDLAWRCEEVRTEVIDRSNPIRDLVSGPKGGNSAGVVARLRWASKNGREVLLRARLERSDAVEPRKDRLASAPAMLVAG